MIPKEWRDYKWEFRPIVVAVWLVVSPAVALPLLWFYSIPWDWLDSLVWDKETAPAWVQAVGSILAVGVAIWVSWYQGKQMLRLEVRRETEMIKKVLGVAKYCGRVAFACIDCLQERERVASELAFLDSGLTDCEYLLRQVEFDVVPGVEASLAWLELRHVVRDVHLSLKATIEDCAYQAIHLAEYSSRIAQAIDRLEASAKAFPLKQSA
ncbi:hypothetical protein [Metapseudomonas resinovorans]|uniref:hypothetical protein n=1 Tax=Metapseudomonas resinovorans TaxID=53412 RepID=UPI003D1B6AAB